MIQKPLNKFKKNRTHFHDLPEIEDIKEINENENFVLADKKSAMDLTYIRINAIDSKKSTLPILSKTTIAKKRLSKQIDEEYNDSLNNSRDSDYKCIEAVETQIVPEITQEQFEANIKKELEAAKIKFIQDQNAKSNQEQQKVFDEIEYLKKMLATTKIKFGA